MLDTLLITIQFIDEIYRRTSFPFISPKQGHIHYCFSFSCVCLFGLLDRPPAPAGRSGLFGDEFSAATTAREAGALLIYKILTCVAKIVLFVDGILGRRKDIRSQLVNNRNKIVPSIVLCSLDYLVWKLWGTGTLWGRDLGYKLMQWIWTVGDVKIFLLCECSKRIIVTDKNSIIS